MLCCGLVLIVCHRLGHSTMGAAMAELVAMMALLGTPACRIMEVTVLRAMCTLVTLTLLAWGLGRRRLINVVWGATIVSYTIFPRV